MIINLGGLVFVTSERESDKYIEVLRSEYDTGNYKLIINNTIRPIFYELFFEWEEQQLIRNDLKWRTLHTNIFSSGKLSKIEKYIRENIYKNQIKENEQTN